MTSTGGWRRFCAVLPVAAALLVAYGPLGPWLVKRFLAPDSYYSHGFLVPLVVAYLIWRRRARLAALGPRPTWWGLALLLPGLGFLVAGG
ncbi:MAG: archaeosortase/exosortase family protein, partial [Planctomycetota bacterium]